MLPGGKKSKKIISKWSKYKNNLKYILHTARLICRSGHVYICVIIVMQTLITLCFSGCNYLYILLLEVMRIMGWTKSLKIWFNNIHSWDLRSSKRIPTSNNWYKCNKIHFLLISQSVLCSKLKQFWLTHNVEPPMSLNSTHLASKLG